MGTFQLPLTAEGAVTAPTGAFVFREPSAETQTFLDVGSANVLEIPEFGWAVADGVNPLRLIVDGGVYDCGGLAPLPEMTLAVTGGARATAVWTYTGQPSNNEYMLLGVANVGNALVVFKDTLVTDGTEGTPQVYIGGDADETWANVEKLINGTGTQGSGYWDVFQFLDLGTFQSVTRMEVSARDPGANTLTMRFMDFGSIGNSCITGDFASNVTVPAGFMTGGSDGTGTAPAAGTYRYFYTWHRKADGAETGRSPVTTITKQSNANVSISVLTASADTTFDYINIYRTTNHGVEFFKLGASPRATLTFSDNVDDETLVSNNNGVPWDDLKHRAYAEGKPPRGLALAYWGSRLWTMGMRPSAEKNKGTVAVLGWKTDPDTASATITFSALGITDLDVGKVFKVDATSEEYTLLSVSESAGTAVLDRKYEGEDDAVATYTISEPLTSRVMQASVPYLYNQQPVSESPGSVDTDDIAGGTAYLATKSRLFGFSRTSIVAVTGDDIETWTMDKVAHGVGCVSQRLITPFEGGGAFLSFDGFYAISPDGQVVCISEPKAPIGMKATGITDTVKRIHWATIDEGYSFYDREERELVFGVPLDGALVPNYEIVFNIQNSTWTTFKRAEWTAMTTITLPNGDQAVLSGDRHGNLWHAHLGASDGFYGTEALQTLTGATVRTLTVAATPFTATGDGEEGKPVVILSADGSTVQYGKVASNTTAILTLCEDLATLPVIGDQILLGGIAWQAKTGFATFGEEYRHKTLRSVTIRHSPTTRGDYYLSFAVNGGSFALCPVGTSIGDLTEGDGKVRHFTQWPGDSHSVQLRGFKPGGRAMIRGGVFDLIVRNNGAV